MRACDVTLVQAATGRWFFRGRGLQKSRGLGRKTQAAGYQRTGLVRGEVYLVQSQQHFVGAHRWVEKQRPDGGGTSDR